MATRAVAEGHRLLGGLLTLDVSTVVVKEPSGEKAPSMERMVRDLAATYGRFYDRHTPPDVGPDEQRFKDVADLAHELKVQAPTQRHGLTDRVARNARDLDEIVDRTGKWNKKQLGDIKLKERKLKPVDAATIRKAWELADDPVDMTTSVSLHGDALTRFSTRAGTPPGDELLQFHDTMVTAGLGNWQVLMTVVSQFLLTVVGFFFE